MKSPRFHRVDMTRLEEEWADHPQVYGKYARMMPGAVKRHSELEADAELIRAELDLAIRTRPGKYKIDKITEAAVKAAIEKHPKNLAAQDAVRQAQHDINIIKAALQTLEHRKRSLENLVDLHGQDYFSVPRAKKHGGAKAREIEQRRSRRTLDDD